MKKSLDEMTLEELWELFPIYLTEHEPCWDLWYKEEEEYLHTINGFAKSERRRSR